MITTKVLKHSFSKILLKIDRTAVFSLNFSSAGKGPFMDGKAKNIYFSGGGGGGGGNGVRVMDPPSLGDFFIFINFFIIFKQQIKTF